MLQEIHSFCVSGQTRQTDVIIDRIELDRFFPEEGEEILQKILLEQGKTEIGDLEYVFVKRSPMEDGVKKIDLSTLVSGYNYLKLKVNCC